MYLSRLAVHNFRNIVETEILPSPAFNVLWGDNGQGKTNILEAIYIIGHLKSFRTTRNEDLIFHGKEESHLNGGILSSESKRIVDITIEKKGKKVLLDGKEVRNAATFFSTLRPIIFSPEEVSLTKGAPAGRRALIDRAIFQTDPAFLPRAQEYERCLRQRNSLFKTAGGKREIEIWTEALLFAGSHIRRSRAAYLTRITPLLNDVYGRISGNSETASITFPYTSEKEQNQEIYLRKELERCRHREIHIAQTLAGPHRDDPFFQINGRSVRQFASQGQQRSFMLAFKTAQIIDIEEQTGEPPVLLLDDMTSELDKNRQEYFFDFLLTRKGQVFVTTTDIKPMISAGLTEAKFFKVKEGTLRQDQ
jgi:DNA replication and repair protein RecF